MKPFVILQREIAYYRAVLRDPRTPAISRWCLRAAIAYLLSPIDLIPDFIPVLGQLDDVIIVPLLLAIARFFVPAHVLAEHRSNPDPAARKTPAVTDRDSTPGNTLALNDDQQVPLNTTGDPPQ